LGTYSGALVSEPQSLLYINTYAAFFLFVMGKKILKKSGSFEEGTLVHSEKLVHDCPADFKLGFLSGPCFQQGVAACNPALCVLS
jgi:hypothetical protein